MLASRRRYQNSNAYPGGGYAICDRCSQRWRRSRILVEWDNLRVCRLCIDPRPPQMMPPNVYPEGIPFLDARPPQDYPDRLTDDTALQSVSGGMAVQYGVLHPNGQDQLPGSLSPLSLIEEPVPQLTYFLQDDTFDPILDDNGQLIDADVIDQVLGLPPLLPWQDSPSQIVPAQVLLDDITFITGPVYAPTPPGAL